MKPTNIHALRQSAIDLTKLNRSLLDRTKLEGRELNAQEEAEFNQRMLALKKNAVAIAELEAELDAQRNLVGTDHPDTIAAHAAGAPGYEYGAPARRTHGKIGARYRDLFGSSLRNDGFPNMEAYLCAVHNSSTQYHPALRA